LEGPAAALEVGGFWIDRLAVSNAAFRSFVEDGAYGEPGLWSDEGWSWLESVGAKEPAWWHDERFNEADQPVTGVSFYESEAYARWVGGRLPWEVEWEKAAGGPDGRTFPWGDAEPTTELALYAPGFVPIRSSPVAVDAFPAGDSPYGCRQMAGNLFEWTTDYFHPDSPERRTPSTWAEARPSTRRVLKGGAWTTGESRLRRAARYSAVAGLRDNIVSLRVAYDGEQRLT
jgi:formylglycine-generating enzyme required for sulfatase activity